MISLDSIQLSNTASFPDKDSAPTDIKLEAAHVEGKWYGGGSLGVPFTEALTRTELNLLTELLTTIAARVAAQKEREDAEAPVV
jgi:hypothetical protein